MAETNTPFLSLGSRGTVGDSLTSQKRSSSTLLRNKPTPTDRYTLAQAYQRWLYQDYAYLWTQQTIGVRQQYSSAGVRHHLTGFQYWMKYQLTNLPDIAAWYKLDQQSGALTPDSSRHLNHATVSGPSLTPGIIDHGYLFDDLNDTIVSPHIPAYDNGLDPFTAIIFTKTPATGAWDILLTRWQDANNRWYIMADATAHPRIFVRIAGVEQAVLTGTLPIDDNLPHVIIITVVPGTLLTLYFDGLWNAQMAITNTTWDSNAGFRIGSAPAASYFGGLLDNAIVLNRLLDTTEIARWAERRYPP